MLQRTLLLWRCTHVDFFALAKRGQPSTARLSRRDETHSNETPPNPSRSLHVWPRGIERMLDITSQINEEILF